MPFITPVKPTKLLLQPKPSQSLPPSEWRDRAAGDKLGICGAKKEGNFWRVKLAGKLTIGGTKAEVVYLWPPDWEGVGEVYQATMQALHTKSVESAATIPPSGFKTLRKDAGGGIVEVVLAIGYRSQIDNHINPGGACNVTSFAMGFEYFGLSQDSGDLQGEDILYEWMEGQGLSRHAPEDLRTMAETFGLTDNYSSAAKIDQIKAWIASGRPVITHGYWTSFGHIVVFVGWDETGFWVHDPNGEWTADGYLRNDAVNPARGRYVHYSYGLVEHKCLPDGGCWAHFLDRPITQKSSTPPPTPLLKPQEFRVTEAARAIINSWEGWMPKQYICDAGKSTIGWGSTRWFDGGEVPIGASINEAQARQLQDRDLEGFVAEIAAAIDVPLSENQLSALISWQYNTGAIGAKDCDLRDAINRSAGDAAIVHEFRRWNKSRGEVSQGLVNRRESEVALWEGRDWRRDRES